MGPRQQRLTVGRHSTSDMSGRMLPLPDGIEMIFVSRLELLNVLDEIDAGALPPTDLQ